MRKIVKVKAKANNKKIQKKKITHTEINAKDKPIIKNISQIEQNHILNKNSTITNSTPYQKINELQEKRESSKQEKIVIQILL